MAVSLAPLCQAAPTRNAQVLSNTPMIDDVQGKKEFFVNFEAGRQSYKDLEVFVVVREIEDPLRKGWFDFEFVGRAAVAETSVNNAHFVLYKPFNKGGEIQKGDHLVRTGDPLTLDEMDLLRKEVLGILQRDKELEDLYTGLISVKLGLYSGSLDSTSSNDTNAFKKANSFFLRTMSLRWWFFFNPAVGLNLEYASGTIPTVGFHHEDLSSSQTYLNPGLLYRSRFISLPAIYSLTYFINKFSSTNTDDQLLSSTYSGVNLGVTFYYPYRFQIFRLGPFKFSFNNIEAGFGYAPAVSVSDQNFKRGASVSGHQLSLNGGVEFNLAIRGWRFTDDLFVVLEGGRQSYDFTFSGPTSGTLPSGAGLPEGTINSETQTWYGLRIKYNMRDYLGELLYGL
jgi:hypothetical protein